MAAARSGLLAVSLLLVFLFSSADGILTEQRVYIQEQSITDYLYKYDLPAMDNYTYCLWLNMAHVFSFCYPVSIASGSDSNQHIYGWEFIDDSSSRRIAVYGPWPLSAHTPLSEELLVKMKNGWHKHCFVNKNGEYIKWFMDRQTPGVLEEVQSGASLSTIPHGSALLLFQDQDSFKGGLTLLQACVANMSMFNMWDSAKTLEELNALGCKDQGNVVNMDNLDAMGDPPVYVSEMFQCPDIKGCRLPKAANEMRFRMKEGFTLPGNSYMNRTSSAVMRCAELCSFDDRCQSANFKRSEKMCQLNSVTEEDAILELEVGTIHISSVC